MNRLPITCVLACLPMAATQVHSAETTVFNTHITNVMSEKDGKFYITVAADSAACTSGSVPKRYYVIVGQNSVTADGAKMLYSAALTAMTAGMQISLLFEDSTTHCSVNRILLRNQ